MESSIIRDIFIFENWAGAWKTIMHSSKIDDFELYSKYLPWPTYPPGEGAQYGCVNSGQVYDVPLLAKWWGGRRRDSALDAESRLH